MNSSKKKIGLNLIFSVLAQIVTIGIGIIVPRLFILSFGSETNGFINSLNQIFVYVALLEAGVGGASLQALYSPVANNDKDKINAILSATNKFYKRTGLFYCLAVVCISFIYPLIIVSSLDYWLMFSLILLIGLSGSVPYFIQAKYRILLSAEGKNYLSSIISSIQSISLSAARLILLLLGMNVLVVQSAYLIINLIIGLCCSIYIKKNYGWINFKVKPDVFAISKKKYVIIHQISSLIFNNTDVLLLTFFCDLQTVSVYALIKTLIGMISKVLDSILTSVNFKFGQTFNNKDRFIPMIKCFEVYFIALTFCLCTIAYIFIDPFLSLYTKNMDINYIIPLFSLLMIIAEILNYARMVSLNIINYAGHFKETVWRTILETFINLTISIIFVNIIGINGVVLGTIAALLYRTFDMIFYSNKKLLGLKAWSSIKIWFVNVSISLLIGFICKNIQMNLNSYFSIIISASVLLFLLLPLYFLMNSLFNKPEFLYAKVVLKSLLIRKHRSIK